MICLPLSRFLPDRLASRHFFTRPSPFSGRSFCTANQIAALQQSPSLFRPAGAPSRFLRVDSILSPHSGPTDIDLRNIFQNLEGYKDCYISTYVHRVSRTTVKVAQVEFDTQADAVKGAAIIRDTFLDELAFLVPSFSPETTGLSRGNGLESQNPDLEVLPSQPLIIPMETVHSPARKKAKLDQPKQVLCKICYCEITGPYSKPCLRCHDVWCLDCVKLWFVAASQDSERMPSRCCNMVMHHGTAATVLSPLELELYKIRYDERTTPNPLYCPVSTCSTFIPPRLFQSDKKLVNCTICITCICTKCKEIADAEHDCAKDNATFAKIKAFKYKTCPKCGTGVMKMFGCPHVRCACGAHFCWDCMRAINICYKSPCTSAREDGQYTDGEDESYSVSEDERDAQTTAEIQSARQMPTAQHNFRAAPLGIMRRVLNTMRGRRQRRHSEGETIGQNEINVEVHAHPIDPETMPSGLLLSSRTLSELLEQSDAPELISAPNPARRDSVPLAITRTDGPDANSTPASVNAPAATGIPAADATQEPVTPNLDDPEMLNWEAEDQDFGDEPVDEAFDVWGCACNFNRLKKQDVDEHWIQDFTFLDCMTCFEGIELLDLLNAESAVVQEQEKMKVKQMSKQQRDRLAWNCLKCGVVVCGKCRGEKVKRMKGALKQKGGD